LADYCLEMIGIVKEFPGVRALDGADLRVRPGEVHALLGINGAGKSTLIKILSGVYRKDGGRIRLDGRPIEIASAQAAMAHGIATVYQDPQMIPSFTGYENIYLGAESESGSIFGRVRRRLLRGKADRLLERFPVEVDLIRPVGQLGPVEKETIAILRALSRQNMRVLVLDEPTSILTHGETEVLFRQIHMLKDRGISIVYITHRLDEVFRIADRLTVFRDGRNVATCPATHEAVSHADIAEMMLGRKLANIYPPKGESPGEEVFTADGLGLARRFAGVSFTARKGWILGIFGLVGSGIDELCKCLFGVLPATEGTLAFGGRAARHGATGEAIDNGLFLIPGDRRREGQVADESISFNMVLSSLGRVAGLGGLIRRRRERADAQGLVSRLAIKTPSVDERMSLLSGGNQQKVVIAKGLYTDADVYVLQEPTAGVDVGAKAGIYELIRKLAVEKAVIVVGSDCEEVLGLCDHAMVLYQGGVAMDGPARDVRLEQMLLCGLTGRAEP